MLSELHTITLRGASLYTFRLYSFQLYSFNLSDWVCVGFADAFLEMLENPVPPLIYRIILLEQLSLADGLQPLQQHT